MVAKKHKSKRLKAKDKYKIISKVKEHHRKVRKQQKGRKPKKNEVIIPNLFPLKEEILTKEPEPRPDPPAASEEEEVEDEMDIVEPQVYLLPKQYKLISEMPDCQLIQCLDARDPEFSRINIKSILVLTKSDLVPKSALQHWVKQYSAYCVVIPFSSKLATEESIQLISKAVKGPVGIIGYPGTGKSTLLAHLKKAVDCFPFTGIGFSKTADASESARVLLRNYSSAAKVPKPLEVVEALIEKLGYDSLIKKFDLILSNNVTDFLVQLARKQGFVRKHGILDTNGAARFLIQECYENRLQFFTLGDVHGLKKQKQKKVDCSNILGMFDELDCIESAAVGTLPFDSEMENLPKGYKAYIDQNQNSESESDFSENEDEAEIEVKIKKPKKSKLTKLTEAEKEEKFDFAEHYE